MTIAPNDIMEASARLEFDGVEDVVGVFQFRHDGVAPISDTLGVDDILEFLEVVYGLLNSAITAITLYRDVRIRNVTQDTVLGTFSWPTLVAGGTATDATPPGVAALLSFSTQIPRVAPRKYFGVLSEGGVGNDGRWTAGVTALLAAAGIALLFQFTATNSDWQYGYLSPKTAAFEVPTGVVVTDIPAYQRRRRQGRGS